MLKDTMTEIAPLPVNETDDLLWKHLKTIPAFRGILRAVEARFYQQIEMPHPILDVGCGDGHFAQVTFDEQIDVGIDPWWGPLQHSKRNNTYGLLLQSLGDELPFPDEYFASAFSNSVLEHIPEIQSVLNETSRVLQKNGRFVITMPCHHFNDYLGGVSWLRKIGANGLAERYESFATRITRHVHVNQPEVWADRLAQAGMKIEQWQYYFSPKAVQALEIGHIQGVPSAIMRALTGHWIVAPWEESLARTERWLRPYYEEETAVDEGAYIFIVAKKAATHPISAPLPEPKPFTITELMQAEARKLSSKASEDSYTSSPDGSHQTLAQNADLHLFDNESETQVTAQQEMEGESSERGNLLNYAFIVASLFLAGIGQLIISGSPEGTGRGSGWLVLSGLLLFLIGFQQGYFSLPNLPSFTMPTIQTVSRKRWLILPALLLSLFAQGFGSGNGTQRPFLAFIFWFSAITLGIFSLRQSPKIISDDTAQPALDSQTWYYALLFFGIAFSLRVFDLTSHPFMLNGIEASLGLDAINVIQGGFRNPFAVGWLTNPSLPSFVSAIPILIFGPSTFSARILSPFIGALTVTAVYLIAKRLWNETVGLTGAILLTGSHFHLHYSRLGMTNVWDALFALLALGFVGIAWQTQSDNLKARRYWLIGGLFIGLNAYLFTASRLMPIMLALLLITAILFDRKQFQNQFRHIIAAALLALVVALPQMLYYNNHPGVLMERAFQLGIFADQSGWLGEQAIRAGTSETAVLRQQLWQGFTAFNGGIDRSPSYRSSISLISFGPGLFFMIGLIISLLKLGENRFRMLLIWVGTSMLFAGSFLIDLPTSHRLVIATPALAILAAIALDTYGQFLFGALPEVLQNNFKLWLKPTLVVLAMLLIMGDLFYYYGRFRSETQIGDRNTEIADQMAHYLESQSEPATAYFFGAPAMFADFPTITYIAQSYRRGLNLFDVDSGETAVPPAQTDKLLFIFLPERATEIDSFQVQYPGGTLHSFSGVYGDPLFLIYEVKQ